VVGYPIRQVQVAGIDVVAGGRIFYRDASISSQLDFPHGNAEVDQQSL
jgi:hypothetical protein